MNTDAILEGVLRHPIHVLLVANLVFYVGRDVYRSVSASVAKRRADAWRRNAAIKPATRGI